MDQLDSQMAGEQTGQSNVPKPSSWPFLARDARSRGGEEEEGKMEKMKSKIREATEQTGSSRRHGRRGEGATFSIETTMDKISDGRGLAARRVADQGETAAKFRREKSTKIASLN
jgi:hypothetical protein